MRMSHEHDIEFIIYRFNQKAHLQYTCLDKACNKGLNVTPRPWKRETVLFNHLIRFKFNFFFVVILSF